MPLDDPPPVSNPPVLTYAVSRRVNQVSIETYPGGVIVVAHFSWVRWLFHLGLLAGAVLILLAIAWPSRDEHFWQGLTLQRARSLARVVSGVLGTALGIVFLLSIFAPRGTTTLRARSGRFGYAAPGRMHGEERIDCALSEIESIDYEPWDGETGGTLSIKVARLGRRWLFPHQERNEIKEIAEALIPVWRDATQIRGGSAAD